MATTIPAASLLRRGMAIARGITINGLVILTEPPITVASLYPEVVSDEYCLHDCRGAIVGLEQVPIDAERDRARAVPEVHICAIEIRSARTRSSVAASARAAAGLEGASRLPGCATP